MRLDGSMGNTLPGTVGYSRGFRRDMPERNPGYPFRPCIIDLHGNIVCESVYTYRYVKDAVEDGCSLLWWLMRGNRFSDDCLGHTTWIVNTGAKKEVE